MVENEDFISGVVFVIVCGQLAGLSKAGDFILASDPYGESRDRNPDF